MNNITDDSFSNLHYPQTLYVSSNLSLNISRSSHEHQTKQPRQITITVSTAIDSFGLQRHIDYLKYLEATAQSKATQTEVDLLAEEVNTTWWKQNRDRFVQEKSF